MFYNPYIIIPFAVWLITQALKFSIAALRGRLDFKYLYASGGMPSVHSAVVCSLATTALLTDGASSHLFGFTVLFAAIVMYDSFGVRRSAGEQAVAINMIIESLERDRVKLERQIHLREILGHKPAEVTVGAVLGIFLALLFNISHLSQQLTFLSTLPGRLELLGYGIVFVAIIAAGLITKVILAGRYKGSKIIDHLSRQILLNTQTTGWLGLVVAFGQYQRLPYILWRVWSWMLILAFLVWMIWIAQHYTRLVPEKLAEEREHNRKQKWFDGKKKRR